MQRNRKAEQKDFNHGKIWEIMNRIHSINKTSRIISK